jgi:hypothetical protein
VRCLFWFLDRINQTYQSLSRLWLYGAVKGEYLKLAGFRNQKKGDG